MGPDGEGVAPVRFRTLATVLAILGSTVILTACSATATGTPLPTTTTGNDPTTTTNPDGPTTTINPALRVTNPLNASTMIAKPCTALATNQVDGFGITNTISGPNGDANGVACDWNGDTGPILSVNWETIDKDGISDFYTLKSIMAYFIPTSVDGYPAVYADSGDDRSTGDCTIQVGVNDHLFFSAEYNLYGGNATPACNGDKQIASFVIQNLQGVQ